MARRIYRHFFTELENHAHPVVQEAIKFVEEREAEWFTRKESAEIGTIRKVISYFIDQRDPTFDKNEKREREVFHYFCASVVYAEIIKHSCLNREKLDGDLAFPREIFDKVSLEYLNKIAKKIIQKLIETVHLHYTDDDTEHDKNINEIENILKDRSGRLASRQSRGNIPFLTVYKGKSTSVSLRRGIELYLKPPKDDSNKVITGDEKLNHFPVRVYHNDYHSETRVGKDQGLEDVIQNNYVRKRLFTKEEKHITWIHKSAVEYNRNRTLYQIDLIDKKRNRFVVPDERYRKALRKIVGSDSLVDPTNSTPVFKEEDLLISFFAYELFQYDSHEIRRQDLEDYSDELIKKYVQGDIEEMFIGFCFHTLQDSGHSNHRYASGSKNILLLALTRGLTKLLYNMSNQEAVYSLEEDGEFGYPDQRRELIDKICFDGEMNTGRFKIKQRRIVKGWKFYLGGNDGGVMVKVDIVKKMLGSWILLGIILIVTFAAVSVYLKYKWKLTNNISDKIQIIGSILEWLASIVALCILGVKVVHNKWKFEDMIHSRKRCRSLKELIRAMKGKRKEKRREKAIKLCATIPKPETVFSYHKSCSFTSNGNGQFYIDDDIDVSDLEKAGYKFGVTFYGEQVVADARGNVRNFYIRSKNDEQTLHIADNHERQHGIIFCLPTLNKFVGSGSSEDENFS